VIIPFLPIIQRSRNSGRSLITFISYDHVSPAHKQFAFTISTLTELTALLKNHTWDFVKLPSHKKAIGCKWVFKLKLHADGTIERHKAILVAKGFTQIEGID
jgi:hypothetical protein